MTSVSYPQVVQGLQLQSNEFATLHDQTLMSSLAATTSNRPISHFYHELSKQPANISTTASSTVHNQLNQNENLSIQSLSNPIEII